MLNENMIDFYGIGNVFATFKGPGGLNATSQGKLFKMTGNKTIGIAGDGNVFHGLIIHVEKDEALGTQIGGYVEVPYTGTAPTVGYSKLAANATGGVKVDATNGRDYLVVSVDTTEKTVGFFI